MDFEIDRFEPGESEQRANVNDAASRNQMRLSIVQLRVRYAIEDVSNIAHTEEPSFWRGTGSIH